MCVFIDLLQNDTMQVVWQYHAEEPVSIAAGLPEDGTVRGSRPLYLVQRDSQSRRTSRNQAPPPPLETWDVLNQQVSTILFIVSSRCPGTIVYGVCHACIVLTARNKKIGTTVTATEWKLVGLPSKDSYRPEREYNSTRSSTEVECSSESLKRSLPSPHTPTPALHV